jgi:hypothetical protein
VAATRLVRAGPRAMLLAGLRAGFQRATPTLGSAASGMQNFVVKQSKYADK